jgi:hypothetical protein
VITSWPNIATKPILVDLLLISDFGANLGNWLEQHWAW